MTWWTWLGAGLLLLTVEVLTPGSLYWIFLGAGAIAVALLCLAVPSMGFVQQALLFVGLSGVSLMFFRKPMLRWLEQRSPQVESVDALVGEVGTALSDIPPGAVGKIELRGTNWSVTNAGHATIPSSARCRVERVDGLMLIIRGDA
jgi:membrane protein implicated in regulation of membrane protease activity